MKTNVEHPTSNVQRPTMESYLGLPWKHGGRSRAGIDCAGLAELFLREQFYPNIAEFPVTPVTDDGKDGLCKRALRDTNYIESKCGDLVLFRKKSSKRITHCEVYLGDGRYLGIMRGSVSRVINGLTLIDRLGWERAGAISVDDMEGVIAALRSPGMGEVATIVAIIVSVVLSLAAAFLMPRPNLGKNKNQVGRYSYDALITRSQSDIPLPDILGSVTVAGNSPFTSPADATLTVSDPTVQKANKVVILASGPVWNVDTANFNVKINGIQFNNTYWKSGTGVSGFELDPAQTKAEAVDGTIRGISNVPSFTIYPGDYDVTVPVDVRAQYDRNFPVYGFSGCCYAVFRMINSTKFSDFNLTAVVLGRLCRTFDTNGFVSASSINESLAGADGSKVRFLFANPDVVAVSSVTVGGTAYSLMSASNQTGNVYWVNKTKGYVEFLTAPSSGATILVSYTYYPRVYSSNPALHVAYLLTENMRGKGFDGSVINWPAFCTARDYYDQVIAWGDDTGFTTSARYQCSYSIDVRKPIQDHIQAVLDCCYSWLFLTNGKWVLKPRAAASSVMSFDATNMVADSFYAQQIDRTDRANQVQVVNHPDTSYNAEDGVFRNDRGDQDSRAANFGNNGIVPQVLQIPACPDDQQSARLGEQVLRENVRTVWMGEFTTNIQGLPIETGDVIDLTPAAMPNWVQKLVRVENIEYDANDQMKITFSEYVAMAYI